MTGFHECDATDGPILCTVKGFGSEEPELAHLRGHHGREPHLTAAHTSAWFCLDLGMSAPRVKCWWGS